ncbi:MAG: hypothetical protein R3223_12175, partial [Longimicrobiales bacterium]|nr:hypothetical protein [Longimicrobiales bacterium]
MWTMVMEKRFLFLPVCALGATLVLAGSVSAQDATAEIAISGTSTVRNWTCYVTAPVEIGSGESAEPAPGFEEGVQSVTVTVQIDEIECPEDDMREHLQEAMHAEEY